MRNSVSNSHITVVLQAHYVVVLLCFNGDIFSSKLSSSTCNRRLSLFNVSRNLGFTYQGLISLLFFMLWHLPNITESKKQAKISALAVKHQEQPMSRGVMHWRKQAELPLSPPPLPRLHLLLPFFITLLFLFLLHPILILPSLSLSIIDPRLSQANSERCCLLSETTEQLNRPLVTLTRFQLQASR